MKRVLVCFLLLIFIGGCKTSSGDHHANIVDREVSRLSLPTKQFSDYGNFQLKEMVLNNEISKKSEKVKIAQEIETKLQAKALPLFKGWMDDKKNNSVGMLTITPQLHSLRVVSRGARFWIGGMAGGSNIDMDLLIVDVQTGETIAKPRLAVTASSVGGEWSVGATDKNLANYVVDISYQYLKNNY